MAILAFLTSENEKIGYLGLLCIAEKKQKGKYTYGFEFDRFSIFPINFHLPLHLLEILFFQTAFFKNQTHSYNQATKEKVKFIIIKFISIRI